MKRIDENIVYFEKLLKLSAYKFTLKADNDLKGFNKK